MNRIKRRFLRLLDTTLNRLTRRLARSGRGPFALVRHVGRKSGKTYETPLILARAPAGFIAELTYGTDVNWYRNIVAAGECVVVFGGDEHRVDRIEPCDRDTAMRAYGFPAAFVLRVLRRHEFRLLRTAATLENDLEPPGPG